MHRLLALSLAVVLLLAGCASYTARPVPTPISGTLPIRGAAGPVLIALDPYFEVDRQKAVFDEALTDEGILAIQLFVQNTGDSLLVVRPSEMVLAFPDGRQLTASGANAAAARVSGGVGSVIGPAIAFGLVGLLVASHAQDQARTERMADYRSKELPDLSLAPGDARHGFVFFIGPKDQPFWHGELVVRVIDPDRGATVVRLPLATDSTR